MAIGRGDETGNRCFFNLLFSAFSASLRPIPSAYA